VGCGWWAAGDAAAGSALYAVHWAPGGMVVGTQVKGGGPCSCILRTFFLSPCIANLNMYGYGLRRGMDLYLYTYCGVKLFGAAFIF
jgi:hypothetical protein